MLALAAKDEACPTLSAALTKLPFQLGRGRRLGRSKAPGWLLAKLAPSKHQKSICPRVKLM